MASWGGIPVARQDGSQSSRSLEPSGPVVGVGRESCGASCLQAARSQGCRTPARSSKALDQGLCGQHVHPVWSLTPGQVPCPTTHPCVSARGAGLPMAHLCSSAPPPPPHAYTGKPAPLCGSQQAPQRVYMGADSVSSLAAACAGPAQHSLGSCGQTGRQRALGETGLCPRKCLQFYGLFLLKSTTLCSALSTPCEETRSPCSETTHLCL